MGQGISGHLKRKLLVAPPRNLVSHPKIHMKIDKRRKAARVEDLSCHDKMRHEDWCEGEEYLDYELDGSHCDHTNNDQTCTKLHSDTETDSSLASLIVQTNWSDDEVSMPSELSDHLDVMEESEKKQEPCPIHGNAVDNTQNANVRNINLSAMNGINEDVTSLCDIVKTYLLSSDYPHDIDLTMINRFCSVPIKLLQVKLTPPINHERQNPEPVTKTTLKIKDCSIRLSRITVATCEPDPTHIEESQSDSNSPNEDIAQTKDIIRPKRKVAENKTNAETDSDSDE